MILHENRLPADDSHKLSCLICYFLKSGKICNCRLLLTIGGALLTFCYVLLWLLHSVFRCRYILRHNLTAAVDRSCASFWYLALAVCEFRHHSTRLTRHLLPWDVRHPGSSMIHKPQKTTCYYNRLVHHFILSLGTLYPVVSCPQGHFKLG